MNRNQQGQIPKDKRSMLSKEKSDSSSTREMVAVSGENLLEMEETLRILTASDGNLFSIICLGNFRFGSL